jgi:S1-C subfamily serine protease
LSGTVTLGIVSTVSRPGVAISEVIQTDAAINPGNSGGALVNSRGELVGINSMIYTETGGYQGIGFAIPSNTAREIMGQLMRYGEVRWGSIGALNLLTVDRAVAQYNGLGDVVGAGIRAIAQSSSAFRAGLRRGDVIVEMNGQKITDADQLTRLIIAAQPGSVAKIVVVRNGRRLPFDVPVVNR